jgi:hypothetical protein
VELPRQISGGRNTGVNNCEVRIGVASASLSPEWMIRDSNHLRGGFG